MPHGVSFIVNGQVHGSLPPDFVKRKLKFDYLDDRRRPLLVTVDCTAMDARVREDFLWPRVTAFGATRCTSELRRS